MAMVEECGQEEKKIRTIFEYLKFKINFAKEHPDYFEADGLLIFIGPQGSGKSLSAVNYVYKLLNMFPKAKLCTNLQLRDYPIVTFEEFKEKYSYIVNDLKTNRAKPDYIDKLLWQMYVKENRVFEFKDNDDFEKYENGEQGVIYLVDEIQLYLNSLESKNVNMDTMTELSQQRKQRKHIVCTSQVFGRLAKPLREQFSNVIVCKKLFGFIQRNSYVDRDSIDTESSADTTITGKVKKNFLWFHKPEMYSRYDTYAKIKRAKFADGDKQKGGTYENGAVKLSGSN